MVESDEPDAEERVSTGQLWLEEAPQGGEPEFHELTLSSEVLVEESEAYRGPNELRLELPVQGPECYLSCVELPLRESEMDVPSGASSSSSTTASERVSEAEPILVTSFDLAVQELMDILRDGALKSASAIAVASSNSTSSAPSSKRPPREAVVAELISEFRVRDCLVRFVEQHERTLQSAEGEKLEARVRSAEQASARRVARSERQQQRKAQRASEELEDHRRSIEQREQAVKEREVALASLPGGRLVEAVGRLLVSGER